MPSDLRELAAMRRASWRAGVRAFHESAATFQQAVTCLQEATHRQQRRMAGRPSRTVWVPSLVRSTAIAERRVAEPSAPTHPPPIAGDAGAALTPRQREVAALIARGLTNQQIADRLVLTKGTVANHVEHILARLSSSSRTQIAVWAVQQGLVSGPGGESDELVRAASGDRWVVVG